MYNLLSYKGHLKTCNEVVIDAKISLGDHQYPSNFVVTNRRYDALLGMLWHYSEAGWLEYLLQLGITQMALIKGKENVLEDAISRAPHIIVEKEVNPEIATEEVLQVEMPSGMCQNYETDQLFGPIYPYLKGEVPKKGVQRDRLGRLSISFHFKDGVLYYGDKIFVPRLYIKVLLRIAHDCFIPGHFTSAKILARLDRLHWENKAKDVLPLLPYLSTDEGQQDKDDWDTRTFGDTGTTLGSPLNRFHYTLARDEERPKNNHYYCRPAHQENWSDPIQRNRHRGRRS